jgi:hypothetical protein
MKQPEFLSAKTVSDDYLGALRADLDQADILRFVVAYVADSGTRAIGLKLLATALQHPSSLGVASLSCACGFEALLKLQNLVGTDKPRLKYFVDTGVKKDDPRELTLMHSKLIYIVRRDGRAVVYVGSHNWSARALGGGTAGPRNTEASVRMEFDFDQIQLEGTASDLGSEVNRHILDSYHAGACLQASEVNREIFENWQTLRCEQADTLDLERHTVILAIGTDPEMSTAAYWVQRAETDAAILFLPGDDSEARFVREEPDRILIMVWPSRADFEQSNPPVLLYCVQTASELRSDASLHLEGAADAEFRGKFGLVVRDPVASTPNTAPRRIVRASTTRPFQFFDCDTRDPKLADSDYAANSTAPSRFFLQVIQAAVPEAIRATAVEPWNDKSLAVWEPTKIVLAPKKSAPSEVRKNLAVGVENNESIKTSLKHQFSLSEEDFLVVPTEARKGVEVSHPILDACVGVSVEDWYAQRGEAVPEGRPLMRHPAMQPAKRRNGRDGAESEAEPEMRVQKVFQQQLDAFLREIGFEWSDEAKLRWVRGESTVKNPGSNQPSTHFDRIRSASATAAVAGLDQDAFGLLIRQAIEHVFEKSKRAPLNETPSHGDKRTLYEFIARQVWPKGDIGREELEAVKSRVADVLKNAV